MSGFWVAAAVVTAAVVQGGISMQQGNVAKKTAKTNADMAIQRADAAAAKLKADEAAASTMARNRADARRSRMQRGSQTVFGGAKALDETTASKKLLGN